MATALSPDLNLVPLRGKPRTLRQQLTTFHLLLVVADPYDRRGRVIKDTAARILDNFDEADVRCAWLVAAGATESKRFLGARADDTLVFVDNDRETIKALNVGSMPALIHIGMDGSVIGQAEGWDPPTWQRITDNLALLMSWNGPTLPGPYDPPPFDGAPV